MLLNQVHNDDEEYLSCYSLKHTDNHDHDEERKKIINSSLETERKRRVCTSSRKRRLNVVRFSNHDQVIHIPHIVDIPQKQIDQCWMNDEDHSFIRSRSLRLVEMMEDEKKQYPISSDTNTMIVNNHLVCVRGLEGKTLTRVYEHDERQRKLYDAVFRVQQQQRQQGERGVVDSQEAIRQASKKYSKKSTKSARLVGISDEANASYSSRQHGHRNSVLCTSSSLSTRSWRVE